MNSENSGIPDSHRLLINLTDKINLKEVINKLLYQALHRKI